MPGAEEVVAATAARRCRTDLPDGLTRPTGNA